MYSGAGEAAEKLVSELLLVDAFYDSIGGLAGYQLKCLEMMLGSKKDYPAEQPSTDAGTSTVFCHAYSGSLTTATWLQISSCVSCHCGCLLILCYKMAMLMSLTLQKFG